jgi:predicted AAA+ superfamily ATPase
MVTNSDLPFYYWSRDKNTAEIEFVVQYEDKIIPIEVNSTNTRSASLEAYTNL